MTSRTKVYEMRVNWRQLRRGVSNPSAKPAELVNEGGNHSSDLSLFLPLDQITDVATLRDWLHDNQHVNGQYEMFGRYEHQRDRFQTHVAFKGVVLVFKRAVDAVHFRLFWQADLVPTACAA